MHDAKFTQRSSLMRHSIISLLVAASAVGFTSGLALAADPHASGTTGQPNQSCEDLSTAAGVPLGTFAPGNSFTSNGTFNPNGNAAQNYAGNGPNGPPSNVPGAAHAVSQYDVACFQQSQKQLP
jgi:hypothetical protein